jgi:hypothetical protein
MVNYLDNETQKLKKGFYKLPNCNELFYFTGRYESGLAAFEKENEIGKIKLFYHTTVNKLSRMDNEEANKKLENLKEKVGWLEKKLKE